jgi:hypothetical protein
VKQINDPVNIVRELTQRPHRGTATAEAAQARHLLQRHLESMGATVEVQSFPTPATFITPVAWFVGGLLLGLLLSFVVAWLGFLLVLVSAILAYLFFDWRYSPVISLPPRVTGHNVIGRFPSTPAAGKRLILMAHYDTAPISYLYRPQLVKDFARSLRISVGLMILAVIVAGLAAFGVQHTALTILRLLLIVYFVVQFVLSSIDFFRLGYSNGASDNATGVATVLAAARRLQADMPHDWALEVVLTSAEEVGMVGARAYYLAHKQRFDQNTYLLNVDTVGAGSLKIITATGSLSNIPYHNALVDTARQVAAENGRFADVETAVWRTGDFDTAWFVRASIPCLTLAALDEGGSMPNIHRPQDTMANVDAALVHHTIDLAEAIARRLFKK